MNIKRFTLVTNSYINFSVPITYLSTNDYRFTNLFSNGCLVWSYLGHTLIEFRLQFPEGEERVVPRVTDPWSVKSNPFSNFHTKMVKIYTSFQTKTRHSNIDLKRSIPPPPPPGKWAFFAMASFPFHYHFHWFGINKLK